MKKIEGERRKRKRESVCERGEERIVLENRE